MTGQEMWEEFSQNQGISAEYDCWSFGDDADTLAQLVLRDIKTATCSLQCLYEAEGEPPPREGQYSVVLDSRDQAVCIIQTTKVYQTPFSEITPDHARKEGEGNHSLSYWRRVHEAFFTEELKEAGLAFREDLMLVCEEFRRLYP